MKKWFPYYKGKCIAKTPLGYTTKANAQKRIDMTSIIEDFDKLFDEQYWFEKYYTYKMVDSNYSETCGVFRHFIDTKKTKIGCPIYLKDLTGDVRKLFEEYFKLYRIKYYEISDEDNARGFEIAQQLNDMYYSVFLYIDKKDYEKKLKQFIKDNVQFIEKEVSINVEDV